MIITGTRRDHRVTDTVLVVTAVAAVVILPRTLRRVTSGDEATRMTVIPAIGGRTKITEGTTTGDHHRQTPTPSAPSSPPLYRTSTARQL